MAKTESTAVNDLIKIAATQTPLASDPSEDLMFSIPSKKDRNPKLSARATAQVPPLPLPRERAPHGTQENLIARSTTLPPVPPVPPKATRTMSVAPPPSPSPAVARTKTPPPLPSSSAAIVAPAIDEIPIDVEIEPIATRTTRPSLPPPARAPLPPPSRPALPSEYPVVSAVHSLPMAPSRVDRVELEVDDSIPFHGDSTAQVARPRTTLGWLKKLAPVAAGMVILGVAVGAYIARENKSAEPPAAGSVVDVKAVGESEPVVVMAPMVESPAAVAAPVTPPNLAPTATEAEPTAPDPVAAPTAPTTAAIAARPVFVDIRIDSRPSGATVMLVDRGKQTFLGTTPISTAVDPSRGYDIVFAYPNRETQIEHLDPKATSRLSVVLGRSGNRATPEVAKPVAPTTAAVTPLAAKPSVAKPVKVEKPARLIEPTWDSQPVKAEPVKVEAALKAEPAPRAAKAVGGNGVLMISSKPPCEILVDGKPTGLMTPQRALPLPAGKHRITLVNPAQQIKKTLTVEITANASTKVIQDLMP